MTVDTAKKVADLIAQREVYRRFLHIARNYDAKVRVVVGSLHNDNTKNYAEQSILADKNLKDAAIAFAETEIARVDAEIEDM